MKIFSLLLCLTLLLGVSATHFTDLTTVHFPPRAMELRYSPMANVIQLNYESVSRILTSVMEVEQTIAALKNHLV